MDDDDKVWQRLPSNRPLSQRLPAGKPPSGVRPYAEAYHRIERKFDPPEERAYVVVKPCKLLPGEVEALLVHETGRVMYQHICSHPHWAFLELWARRPTRQYDHQKLAVDPHPYTLEELKVRQHAVYLAYLRAEAG